MQTSEIKPAAGSAAEALDRLMSACHEMIQVATLEKSGIRDGDGFWHGTHVMEHMMDDIRAAYDAWQAPHRPKPESVKATKLAHYAEREPLQLVQIDGFAEGDEVMGRDADGQAICGSVTTELMIGNWAARVLIPPDADPATVATLLRKAIAWIERGAIEEMSEFGRQRNPERAEGYSGIPF